MNNHLRSLPAEWHRQDGIMLVWPHTDTDWFSTLHEVTRCYIEIARNIVLDEQLIIVAPSVEMVQSYFSFDITGPESKIHVITAASNDTWARDLGPITVIDNGTPLPLNFKFNAWGMKFAANHDNQINLELEKAGLFKTGLENHLDMVLEGGSIESDGNGTLMTTSQCLLSPNRNEQWDRSDIEQQLMTRFGARKVLWLDYGFIAGDDTDSHIDTLARFAPNNTIIYCGCNDPADIHYDELQHMKEQLATFTDADGNPYRLIELPIPEPIFDNDDNRLPATYANFLITNRSVLVPTYNQPTLDLKALDAISQAFPNHQVKGIDCTPLIEQHGSLHCITMQFPENTLKF